MAKLVDQFGQPLESGALDQPQTSRLTTLHRQVAGHPSRGINPARLNSILESAEQGNLIAQHELFRDMEERENRAYEKLPQTKEEIHLWDNQTAWLED